MLRQYPDLPEYILYGILDRFRIPKKQQRRRDTADTADPVPTMDPALVVQVLQLARTSALTCSALDITWQELYKLLYDFYLETGCSVLRRREAASPEDIDVLVSAVKSESKRVKPRFLPADKVAKLYMQTGSYKEVSRLLGVSAPSIRTIVLKYEKSATLI